MRKREMSSTPAIQSGKSVKREQWREERKGEREMEVMQVPIRVG